MKIDNETPPPGKRNQYADFFAAVGVGDSFICDQKMKNAAAMYFRRHGMVATVKKESDGQWRVWRVK